MRNPSNGVLAALAVLYFLALWLPSFSPHYGFYSDELYYLACADRLALGYVDQPPFFVWLLRLHREIFGDSLVALRVLPVAVGTGTAVLAGLMARWMGGGLFAQVLATLAVMLAPNSIVIFSFFTVNATGIALWTVATASFLQLCRSRDPRWWLVVCGVLGVAFLNKHTAVVPIAGVVVATILTPLRSDLRTRWPWLGGLLFLALIAPNVWWQMTNDFVSLAFYASVEDDRNSATPLEQIVGQIVFQNPAAFPIWLAGAGYFLLSKRARPYRPLGWMFLTGLALGILGGSRLSYRIAGIFPVVFAGGAVLLESLRKPDAGWLRRIGNTYGLPALMLLIAVPASTIILPIQPPELLARNPLYNAEDGSGWRPDVGRNEIPYHLGNRTHWKAFVDAVAVVIDELAPSDRRNSILLTDYFGHAGALEYYGRAHDLPPVYSWMTGYFLWGPPDDDVETVVSIGTDPVFLRANFEQVTTATTFRCTYCPPVVNNLPIRIARGPKRPFSELWPEIGRLPQRRTRLLRAQQARE